MGEVVHADGETLEVARWDGSPADWDAVLMDAPGATACHLAGWDRAMADVLGNEVIRLVARSRDGAAVGLLPLVRVRSRLFGDFLVSMPFLNDGGPVGEPRARHELARAAADHARTLGVDLLELRGRTSIPDRPLPENHRKITVILDMPEDPEELWNGFRSKLRTKIRKPMKEELEVRFGVDQVQPFYDVFARNMRDLGTPVLPRAFFDAIVSAMPGNALAGAVYFQGVPVAGGFGLIWNDEFEMTWSSAHRDYDRVAPNMLLYWAFMEKLMRDGIRRFNFGRCSRDSGTHVFKRQWGGEDVDLPWAQWSGSGATATPTPEGGATGLAVRVWQRLPLAATNRIGPILARRIP